jgi:hypothetical protein
MSLIYSLHNIQIQEDTNNWEHEKLKKLKSQNSKLKTQI